MTIAELSVLKSLGTPTNYRPFVYKYRFTSYTVASYWTDVFGAPDESQSINIFVLEVLRDFNIRYAIKSNLTDAENTEKSFFFSNGEQALYVHFEHEQAHWTAFMSYGDARGYSNKEVYIDDIFYEPLINSIPSLSQQQDLVNYDKLSTINGSIILNNVGGLLDFYKDENIYGNTANIYHLPDGAEINRTRSELQQLGQFLIDDYDLSLQEMDVRIQDKRLENDADMPTEEFNSTDYPDIDEDIEGELIPDMYGQVRRSEAIPVNSNATGTISYRQALSLTTLGTVQVLLDEVWTDRTPTATDLTTGSFTLSQADGRKDGAADGDPLECRVVDSIGEINTYASDVIKQLNLNYLGLEFNSSNYDTTEYGNEETELAPIGILFNEQIKVSEAIRRVQDGADKGFRYEISSTGLRTIRVNNYDRSTAYNIYFEDIKNNNVLPVPTDKEYLAANLKVKYAQDYHSGNFLSIKNTDFAEYVRENYKVTNIITVEKALTSQSDADNFAEWYLDKFSDVPRIAGPLEILGADFFNIRIYDIIIGDLSTGPLDIEEAIPEREFYGRWKMQVLSIDPQINSSLNNITALLIEEIEIEFNVIDGGEPTTEATTIYDGGDPSLSEPQTMEIDGGTP